MKKTLAAFLLLSIASLGLAADAGSWTGVVTETHCGERGANADHASCAVRCVKEKGAKWALWDASTKQMYELANATNAEKLAGQDVTVKGTLSEDKKSIAVASMEPARK
jgi:hypothetical protein